MLSCHIGLLFGKRVGTILIGHRVKKISGFAVHMLLHSLQIYFLHSAEQIKIYVDWLMNLPDACGWGLEQNSD